MSDSGPTPELRVFISDLGTIVRAPVTEELDDDRDATLTLADIVDEGGARRLHAALEDLGDPALKELIVSRKQGSSNPREGARRAREGD